MNAAAHHREFKLTTDDGLSLWAQSWEPPDAAVGVVGVVHGLGDHCGRFAHLAERLCAAGYAAVGYDQRGHGRTAGQRGHVAQYDWLLDDISSLLQTMRARFAARATFLYGQSLGGNLVLNYAARRSADVQGIVAASPLFRPTIPPPFWKVRLGRMMNWVCPRFPFATNIQPEALTHDPSAAEAYAADPLVHHQVSARLAVQMLDAGVWVLQQAANIRAPLLLLHGLADPVTDARASCEFARSAPAPCALRTWPGLFHELHWEREREEVIDHVIHWLSSIGENRCGARDASDNACKGRSE